MRKILRATSSVAFAFSLALVTLAAVTAPPQAKAQSGTEMGLRCKVVSGNCVPREISCPDWKSCCFGSVFGSCGCWCL